MSSKPSAPSGGFPGAADTAIVDNNGVVDQNGSRTVTGLQLASGTIAIPANRLHTNLLAKGIGAGLTTKINVNLGVSEDCCNVEKELDKVRRAVALKADAIMDLSTFGDTRAFRRRTVEVCPVMIGTVPLPRL
mgnify:CR=1 FL=1